MDGSPERIPREELEERWQRCRALLEREAAGAGGLLVFSRLNIYYLTGTFASGVLWLPGSGEPVLLSRKGMERALMESPLGKIIPFRSYQDLPGLLAEAGAPLTPTVAAEMNGLSWALSRSLIENLAGMAFVPGDIVLAKTRAVKSAFELATMRRAGARHAWCLEEHLPDVIRPGMTEREIAHRIWEVFFAAGHQGIIRLEKFGEEVFLGHVAAGDNANYPSVYNGPVGLRGVHPAAPSMGHAGRVWQPGEFLTCDVGFSLDGYTTDKTQVYWSGPKEEIPAEAQAAHRFCADLQERIAGELRPGAVPGELAARSFALAGEAGWSAGFMGLGGNKVGFIGHGIGMAVDEYPVLAKGFDEPLEAGMVLAVEPKIGLPGVGMVGVENTFEVTADGGRCLTGCRPDIICVSSSGSS